MTVRSIYNIIIWWDNLLYLNICRLNQNFILFLLSYRYDGNTLLNTVESYDPMTGKWSMLETPMNTHRCDAGITVVRKIWCKYKWCVYEVIHILSNNCSMQVYKLLSDCTCSLKCELKKNYWYLFYFDYYATVTNLKSCICNGP